MPYIKRPPNAWILFRKNKDAQALATIRYPSLPHIKAVARYWNELSAAQKQEWFDSAKVEQVIHALQYPNYRYQPRRSSRAKGGSRTSKNEKS